MKKLNSLFLLSLAIFLMACGGDDDPSANGIDGEWTAISFNADIESTFSSPDIQPVVSTFSIVASNLNYDLDLNGDNYTTMGDYTITQSGSTDGVSIPEQTSEFTNVSGSGNYTINGDVISVSGSFFELELDGVMMADISGPAEANWSINGDGQLTFSQNQNITQDIPGLTSTTSVVSTSVWERR